MGEISDGNLKEKESVETNKPVVLTMIGFMLFIAGGIGIASFDFLQHPNEVSPIGAIIFAIMLAGMLIYTFCSRGKVVILIGRLTNSLAIPFITGALSLPQMVVIVLAGFGFEAAAPIQGITSFLFGVSLGSGIVTWGSAWTNVDGLHESNIITLKQVTISAALSGVIFFLITLIPAAPVIAITSCIVFGASVFFERSALGFHPPEELKVIESQSRFKFRFNAISTPLIFGIDAGVLLFLLVIITDSTIPLAATSLPIIIGGLALAAISNSMGHTSKLSAVQRIAFPLIGICLLLVPFFSKSVQAILIIIACIGAISFILAFWNVLISLSYRHKTFHAYHYTFGMLAPTAGLLAGWIIGMWVAWLNLGFETGISILCVISVAAILIDYGMTPPGSVEYADEVGGNDLPENNEQKIWDSLNTGCKNVSAKYGLTPRETEILPFLARGRNASHIAEKLVISTYTVKSHIGRIYRKLGVSSQQELIDLVENSSSNEQNGK
ncbi:MAG: helix-turn-helix transcriptional regulator [Coriobacteriales bacterium]